MLDNHKKCLLLNADYTPLSIISWKKAIIWNIKYSSNKNYGIDIIDFYKNDYIIGSNQKKHPIPAVVRSKKFFKNNATRVVFCKKNIFLRDAYTCQYCCQKYDPKNLTYDHVVPKSKWNRDYGSPTTWTNIVTCCVQCNRKKANRTPKQANMTLKTLPIEPNKTIKYLPVSHHLRRIEDQIPQEWLMYLPESYHN